MTSMQQELIEYMSGLEIIDCHEHLVLERTRTEREVDVLLLVSIYAYVDMISAGLPLGEDEGTWGRNVCLDTETSLDERWKRISPYLERIRYGSYYRATAIALRDIYGIDRLDATTYHEASERMRENNRTGLYTRILRERCGIRTCLVQNGLIAGQDPPELFSAVSRVAALCECHDHGLIEQVHLNAGLEVSDLDTYLRALDAHLTEQHRQGAVEFKISSTYQVLPDMESARQAYARWAGGDPPEKVLESTILDFVLRKAEGWGLPVAVHCGVWYDYRTVDPKNMIDIVMRYPDVRFEMYHLGMPFVRDCIFIAKNFPNAYLNLCWCYVVSQDITRRAINEIIDTVPINKVLGFGGDYIWEVENVYGHLVMARETIAEALSERIDRGLLGAEDARHIARLWLVDNPMSFYGLTQTGNPL